LAVLRVDAASLAAPEFSGLGDLRVGNLVLAVARPGRTVRASLGVVSALGGNWRTPAGGQVDRYLQTDVAIYPGFSGGPLVGVSGHVIGLTTASLLRGISVTIPVITLERVVQVLLAHGRVRRGFLGVRLMPVRLPAAVVEQAGQEVGLLVLSVDPNSPAEAGGLMLGDTLIGLDNQPVRRMDDLMALLAERRVGKTTPVRIVRSGSIHSLHAVIGERG
jgi:S1-C subfamily serine protease